MATKLNVRGSTVHDYQETFFLRSVVFRDVKIGLEDENKEDGWEGGVKPKIRRARLKNKIGLTLNWIS